MYMDCLIPLFSHPEPTSRAALKNAVSLAGHLTRHATGIRIDIEISSPVSPMAVKLLDIDALVAETNARLAVEAKALETTFQESCGAASLASHMTRLHTHEGAVVEHLISRTRLHDLTVFPLTGSAGYLHFVAEELLFGTGRPTLVVPESMKDAGVAPRRVVVAWDGSRNAARALSDAMPILRDAEEVRVLMVTGDKAEIGQTVVANLTDHLGHHGIKPIVDVEEARGRSAGTAITDYVARHKGDLLVMGAYGHSRLRDFILGGATKSLLAAPPLPILFSH